MSDHKYGITYDIKPHEGLTADEVKATGRGACDCFVFMSFIGEPGAGGGLSTMVFSGKGGVPEDDPIPELEPHQEYVAWLMYTKHVMDRLPDDDNRKALLEQVFDVATAPLRESGCCDDSRCVCGGDDEAIK